MSVCGVCEQLNQLNSELIRQLGAYCGGGVRKDGTGALVLPPPPPPQPLLNFDGGGGGWEGEGEFQHLVAYSLIKQEGWFGVRKLQKKWCQSEISNPPTYHHFSSSRMV